MFDKPVAGATPSYLALGCGVTAYDHEDATSILRQDLFAETPMPTIRCVIEDVDIRSLDSAHVLPNMEAPIARGIWFPRGYDRIR